MIPQPVYIYHITHVNNLSSIITDGGLRTCCDLRNKGVNYTDIAHETLQDWRAIKEVYCGPGGVIKARVESILIASDHKPLVSVRSDWYY
jgi:hypothetical protein